MTDRLFMMRRKQGSKDALRHIYEKYRDSLLILAIALSHDVNAAEDAVHDVFVAFAGNFANFELTGSLKAYLATCVANRIRDLMRKKQRQAKALSPEQNFSAPLDMSDPSRLIVCNEQLQLLSSALSRLCLRSRSGRASEMPARWASKARASEKLMPSRSCRNLKTSPPAPQPKHLKICRLGLTENEGVFSV